MNTRIMVVDDHPMWREGIARDLTEHGYQVVATAVDGKSAVHIVGAAAPEVILLDLHLPDVPGAKVIPQLLAAHTGSRVLVLSASGEDIDVLAAVQAGAAGYLVKSASKEELLSAVQGISQGDAVFSPGLAGLVLGEFRRNTTPPKQTSLTEREIEVLRLIAKGLTAKQVADRLTISHRTVQNHVQNTLRKLQLNNRAELVRYAIEQGIDER